MPPNGLRICGGLRRAVRRQRYLTTAIDLLSYSLAKVISNVALISSA